MTRQEANKELVKFLEVVVSTQADMRFGQILQAYCFVKPDADEYYLESIDLLRRVTGKEIK